MLCLAFFSLSSASFLSRSASSSSPFPNLLLRMRLIELTGDKRGKGGHAIERLRVTAGNDPKRKLKGPAKALNLLPNLEQGSGLCSASVSLRGL